MADRPRALVLAPEAPFPAAGGGALRCAALIEYLAPRYELDAIVFREPGAPDPAATRLAELASTIRLIQLPFHRRTPFARALRNLARLRRGVPPLVDRFSGFAAQIRRFVEPRSYDLAIIEHFWCAPYFEQLAPRARRVVLDLHNIESVLHARCAATEPWPLSHVHRMFRDACRRLEQRWLGRFWRLLVASHTDADAVRSIVPSAAPLVYPNTIPARPAPDQQRRHEIVFSANLEYHPNISAVRFFRKHIWPRLRRQWPQLTWRLVGKNPAAVARYTSGDPRIRTTGPVEDAVAEIARAAVAVVPVLAGSGTRVKILEAWAAATPVVSTTLGAEGLPAGHGRHLLLADDPDSFAAAVSDLLLSEPMRRRIGCAGRRLFEQRFTWEAGWRTLAAYNL